MGFAVTSSLPPEQAELGDLYEIVDGKKVWPRVGEPETDALYEIVNGERKEIPRMGALAATIASFLVTHLNNYGWSKQLGFAVAEAMLQLAPDRPQRRPDVAFIGYANWRPSSHEDPPAWPVVPLLAAEVVSPTNTAEDMEQKLQDYFVAGVRMVWVVYPVLRRGLRLRIADAGAHPDRERTTWTAAPCCPASASASPPCSRRWSSRHERALIRHSSSEIFACSTGCA